MYNIYQYSSLLYATFLHCAIDFSKYLETQVLKCVRNKSLSFQNQMQQCLILPLSLDPQLWVTRKVIHLRKAFCFFHSESAIIDQLLSASSEPSMMIEHARANSKQCVAECFVSRAIYVPPALHSPTRLKVGEPQEVKQTSFVKVHERFHLQSYTLFHWHLLPVIIIQNSFAHCIHSAES